MVGQEAVGAPLHLSVYFVLAVLHAVSVGLVIQDVSDVIIWLFGGKSPNLENVQSKLAPLHKAIFMGPPRHGYSRSAIKIGLL